MAQAGPATTTRRALARASAAIGVTAPAIAFAGDNADARLLALVAQLFEVRRMWDDDPSTDDAVWSRYCDEEMRLHSEIARLRVHTAAGARDLLRVVALTYDTALLSAGYDLEMFKSALRCLDEVV